MVQNRNILNRISTMVQNRIYMRNVWNYLINEQKKEVTIEYLFYAKNEDKDYLYLREYIDDNSVKKNNWLK